MDVRPQRAVDLDEYGDNGQIILEPLGFTRRKMLANNIGKVVDIEGNQIKGTGLGDLQVYKVMAYIVQAPFKFDSIQGFYNYMDKLDKRRFGSADELFARLNQEIKELENEVNRPLEQSGTEVSSME